MPYKPESFKPESVKRIKKQQEQLRQKEMAKRYDSEWRALRKKHMMQFPFCMHCAEQDGIFVEARECDHIIPIEERPDLRLEPSNLQSLCKKHHSRKTASENQLGFKKEY